MNYNQHELKKLRRGPDKRSWWAGYGPRAALCPPLIYRDNKGMCNTFKVENRFKRVKIICCADGRFAIGKSFA